MVTITIIVIHSFTPSLTHFSHGAVFNQASTGVIGRMANLIGKLNILAPKLVRKS